jgi:hypothetical protein
MFLILRSDETLTRIEWDDSARWLVLEGLVPLLGAAVLYVAFGVARLLAAGKSSSFKYSWSACVDPLGWLYGVAILGMQAGWKSYGARVSVDRTAFCFVVAGAALLQLFAAFVSLGEDPAWRPPTYLKVVAAFSVLLVLVAGYRAHSAMPRENTKGALHERVRATREAERIGQQRT